MAAHGKPWLDSAYPKAPITDGKPQQRLAGGVRLPTENTPRNFYLVSQALKHQKAINKILAHAPCTAQVPLPERLAVIDALHNTRNFSIHALCDALDVKRGTYYNYAKRGKVRTGEIWYMQRKGELEKAVEQVFTESKQRFGAQKIVDALKAEGIATTRKYVLRIMRDLGLHCIRQSAKAIYERLSAERINIVARQFNVDKPNSVWVGDITYFRLKGRTFYICAIMDLYSRLIIAYRISTSNSTRLTKATMSDALVHSGYGMSNISGILLRRLDASGEELDEFGAVGAEGVEGRG